MNQKIALSAEFKRDYVTVAAVVIFLLIIFAEITLAVGIPWYLYRENTMALQVRRLQMRDTFDGLRRRLATEKTDSDAAKAELALISWNMNYMADYLRTYSSIIDSEEIEEVQNQIDRMSVLLGMISKRRKGISTEFDLDTSGYINTRIPKGKTK